jgi:hypothetical protein
MFLKSRRHQWWAVVRHAGQGCRDWRQRWSWPRCGCGVEIRREGQTDCRSSVAGLVEAVRYTMCRGRASARADQRLVLQGRGSRSQAGVRSNAEQQRSAETRGEERTGAVEINFGGGGQETGDKKQKQRRQQKQQKRQRGGARRPDGGCAEDISRLTSLLLLGLRARYYADWHAACIQWQPDAQGRVGRRGHGSFPPTCLA